MRGAKILTRDLRHACSGQQTLKVIPYIQFLIEGLKNRVVSLLKYCVKSFCVFKYPYAN